MIEHALVLPLFILVIICAMELFRVGYVAVTTQFVAARLMREAGINVAAVPDVRAAIEESLKIYQVNLSSSDVVTYCPIDSFATAACPKGGIVRGSPRSLMILTVEQPMSGIVLPGLNTMNIRVTAQVIARNEPA